MDVFVAVLVVLPASIAGAAALVSRRSGHSPRRTAMVFALELLGLLVLGVGLLALLYDGYQEEVSSERAETSGTAVPLLLIGGGVAWIGWYVALGKPDE